MMSDMMARMFRMMILQFMEDQRRRMQEDAERRLYESRGNMWDAEKRLKAPRRLWTTRRPHRQASRRHAEDAADGRGDGARARRGQVPRGVKK